MSVRGRRRWRLARIALLQPFLTVVGVVGTSQAESDPSSIVKAAAAETLFQEAKDALEGDRVGEACSKLAESHRLDPAGGTVLLLGLCREREGKLASAWASLHEALAFARRDGRSDRADRALERIADIAPRLSRLVVVARGARADLEVRLDGADWPRATWGSPVPIDTGTHRIEARAVGRLPFSADLVVPQEGTVRVEVPELASLPPDVPVASSRPAQRTWGVVALAAGGTSLVGCAVAGTAALVWSGSADARCPGTSCPDPRAVEYSRRATTAASFANVTLVAGVALGIAGAILVLTAPRASVRAAQARTWLSNGGGFDGLRF